MPFQLLPNLIFLLSIAGVIILILRRLPEATHPNMMSKEPEPEAVLQKKGLPAEALSQGRKIASIGAKKIWGFMLEAKGLKQTSAVNYRINKFLKRGAAATAEEAPVTQTVELDEPYYIDQIKRFPKDRERYDDLGNFYIDKKNYDDALGVYEYLVKQDPVNPDYWARLGYVRLSARNYPGAVESYAKSVGLDSSHPNRYYNLGLAYGELAEWSEAEAALQQALELEPLNSKYVQALAEVHLKAGDAEKAREVSRRITRMDGPAEHDKDLTNPDSKNM